MQQFQMNIKVQRKLFLHFPLLLFFLVGSVSCMITHSNVRDENNNEVTTSSPEIIFLNYSARSDRSNGEIEIRLIDKYIAEGKLKTNNPEPEISRPGDLKCITLSNRMEPIDSLIIADPLNISLESVDENNALFRKEIQLDSAQFSIRMQLSKQAYAIAIMRNTVTLDQKSSLLITRIKDQ